MTGGGSGGHITPILSVARELKDQKPAWRLVYIGQKGDRMGNLADSPDIDSIKTVRAGKLRRYHGQSKLAQLLDFKTQLLNIRDVFYLLAGSIQSWLLLRKLKPAAILVKGGYVGVPVAWAARWLGLPYITHDSDAVAGLANRLVSKRAAWHATGMPTNLYNYPAIKTSYTGVPVSRKFRPLSLADQQIVRSGLGIAKDRFVVLVIGGSLGARRLNKLVINASPELILALPKIFIIHLSGHKLYEQVLAGYAEKLGPDAGKYAMIIDYSNEVHDLSAVADLVITRAGATTLAELALQARAVITVPNPDLSGGHQLKNSAILKDKGAAVEFLENYLPQELIKLVVSLAINDKGRHELSKKLAATAKPAAAAELAGIIIKTAQGRSDDDV